MFWGGFSKLQYCMALFLSSNYNKIPPCLIQCLSILLKKTKRRELVHKRKYVNIEMDWKKNNLSFSDPQGTLDCIKNNNYFVIMYVASDWWTLIMLRTNPKYWALPQALAALHSHTETPVCFSRQLRGPTKVLECLCTVATTEFHQQSKLTLIWPCVHGDYCHTLCKCA